jgi:hypothetical protein
MQNNRVSRPVLTSTHAHIYGKKVCRNIESLKGFAPKREDVPESQAEAPSANACVVRMNSGSLPILRPFSVSLSVQVCLFISMFSLYQRPMSENSYLRIQGEVEDFPGWLNKLRWKGNRRGRICLVFQANAFREKRFLPVQSTNI